MMTTAGAAVVIIPNLISCSSAIEYDKSIAELNSTRFSIKSKEHRRKLIVEWPKAHKISNGQRDILCVI